VQQEELTAFLMEYQRVSPLTIGELWSLPIMLRFTLVENLRRLAGQMVLNLDRGEFLKPILQNWRVGDGLPEPYRTAPVSAALISSTYAVLRELFPDDAARYTALEQLMMERFPNSTELVRDEHRRQAANQVSIGNVITSMRLISALDWTSFFEAASLVEQTLRRDPSQVYSTMDPESRDRYRHAVEDLAKRTHHTDLDVAELALAQAEREAQSSDAASAIRSHVGYWLIDDGRAKLERELGYRPKPLKRLQRGMRAQPVFT
jgi:cyclic beta-1,2-glucan synthetase